jgi:Na+/H+-dicarboxylate symporter
MGSSIALGMGSWMLFTLLWLLLTTVVAGLLGVAVDQTSNPEWLQIQALMDLLSPNGLYHLLLEIPLNEVDRGVNTPVVVLFAVLWTALPTWLLLRRLQYLTP